MINTQSHILCDLYSHHSIILETREHRQYIFLDWCSAIECFCFITTHNLNTIYWVALILSTDNYITYEEVTQSVSLAWVQYYLSDRFIKYIFYSLTYGEIWIKYYLSDRFMKYIFYSVTFGDIWIQCIALLTYFEILMNYLLTNVHIFLNFQKNVFILTHKIYFKKLQIYCVFLYNSMGL